LSDSFGPFSERAWAVLDVVREVAAEIDATPAQVAIRWTMQVEDITSIPIFGARSQDQLDENVGCIDVSLTDDQYARIATAGRSDESEPWPIYGN
jgi:aryl-alcohol dehydrogenase-like predicted oxidoreductase